MKELLIICSYCDTSNKIAALERLLNQAKEHGLETLLFAKYPISQSIQKLCTYYVFDGDNPFIAGQSLCYWYEIYDFKVLTITPDHGLAVLNQIVKSLSIANSLKYDIAYLVNYDVDISSFPEFSNVAKSKIIEGYHAIGFEWKKQEPLMNGMNLTNIAFKVNIAAEKMNGVLTENLYLRTAQKNQSILAEDVMLEAVKISELKYFFLDPNYDFPAKITVIGDRLNGKINEDTSPISLKYFSNCFVGFDEDFDSPGCIIWTTYEPDLQIEIDFGSETGIWSNGKSKYIRIKLSEPPTMCKILSINGVDVNEIIDHEFESSHWGRNRIQTKELVVQ